jgi:MFS family permease
MLLLNTAFVAIHSSNTDKSPRTTSQHRMGFADNDSKVTKPPLQGGIVAMYYAGALFAAFAAGALSDSHGRK